MDIAILIVIGLIVTIGLGLSKPYGVGCRVCEARNKLGTPYCWRCHSPMIPGLPRR